MLTTSDVFQVFKAAQPALLYLVPFTLLPLFAMAYLKVNFILHLLHDIHCLMTIVDS